MESAPSRSWFARFSRLGSYALWSSAGYLLPMGFDRLVICPLLNRELGPELFGGLLWVLGIMNLIGTVGGNGTAVVLMRSMAGRAARDAEQLLRSALLLTAALSLILVALAAPGSLLVADPIVQRHATAMYVPLAALALSRALQIVVLADLRILRRFQDVFILKSLEAVALLALIVVAPQRHIGLICIVYAASLFVSLPMAGRARPWGAWAGSWWDPEAIHFLAVGWMSGALMSVVDQSQVYVSRIVLGALAGAADVTVLYAGTSIGNMFIIPLSMVSNLVLSLVAGHKRFALRGRSGYLYVALAVAAGLMTGAASFLLGKPIVRALYPAEAVDTLVFYHWIAVANGCSAVMLLLRPIGVRYSRISLVIAMTGVTLGLQIAALAVLIPVWQARGAAIALAGSSAIGGGLWVGLFALMHRGQPAVLAPDTLEGD